MPNLDSPANNRLEVVDGRSGRRARNRDAVIDAVLELYDDGFVEPTITDVVERCGLSDRSVFRYFNDFDELIRAAIERGHDRYAPLSRIHEFGKGPLDARVDNLLEQRLAMFETLSGPSRAIRHNIQRSELLRSDLIRTRLLLRGQVKKQFEPELAAMDKDRGNQVLAALDVLLSFESYDLLRNDQSLTRSRAEAALRSAIVALISS